MIIFLIVFLSLITLSDSSLTTGGYHGISEIETPTSKTIAIYQKAKADILSFHIIKIRGRYKRCTFEYRFHPEFVKPFLTLRDTLDPKELFKALLYEDSVEFFAILFYSLPDRHGRILGFNDINSLKSAFPGELNRIFNNFRSFLSLCIAKLKPLDWKDSRDSSAGYQLLHIIRTLWYSKVRLMSKKLLSSEAYLRWESLIGKRLLFLDIFLAHKTEDLLVIEFRKLQKNHIGLQFAITEGFQSFCFLTKHFKRMMRDIQSPQFHSRLAWFTSQHPLFFIYFFLCLEYNFYDEFPLGMLNMYPIPYSLENFSFYNLNAGKLKKRKSIFNSFFIITPINYNEIRNAIKMIVQRTNNFLEKI